MKIEYSYNGLEYKLERDIGEFMLKFNHYNFLTDQEVVKIKDFISSLNVSLDTALSIRNSYVKDQIIKRSNKIKNMRNIITKEFKKNYQVLLISKKYSYPPVAIMRIVLKSIYNSKTRVKKILQNPEQCKDKRMMEQIKIAEDNDIFSTSNQDDVHVLSSGFEEELGRFLDKHEIIYRTQDQLSSEQEDKYGRAVATPDFLILSDFYVGNTKINWIDAKNFYGAKTILSKKTGKQIRKYTTRWTSGAIFYSYGFSEKLSFSDTLLVDFSVLKDL